MLKWLKKISKLFTSTWSLIKKWIVKKLFPFLWKFRKWGSGILILGFLFMIIGYLPNKRVSSFTGLTQNELATQENEYRKTIAQIIGGIGLFIGLYFTWKRIRISEEGQITERFSRAITHIGDKELDVRLGGIYALERIAKDSKKDHPQIMEILTAFVREHTRIEKNTRKKNDVKQSKLATDTQAAITVVGRRNIKYDRAGQKLDFSKSNLICVNLRETNLKGVILGIANLQEANLLGANLQGAILIRTNLQEANLMTANLQGANLRGANLQKANLLRANLQGANLVKTNLQGANLLEANLQEANLLEANLRWANLMTANLQGANLSRITNWKEISNMIESNIYAVKNAPEGFIEFAKSKGAIYKMDDRKDD